MSSDTTLDILTGRDLRARAAAAWEIQREIQAARERVKQEEAAARQAARDAEDRRAFAGCLKAALDLDIQPDDPCQVDVDGLTFTRNGTHAVDLCARCPECAKPLFVARIDDVADLGRALERQADELQNPRPCDDCQYRSHLRRQAEWDRQEAERSAQRKAAAAAAPPPTLQECLVAVLRELIRDEIGGRDV